jgi:H+-transporting ATPase
VIADAIIGSRKIFQRMKNYCTYSVMAVIRIVFTFGLLTLIFNFFFPTIAIVILAILNDVSMITISKDRVKVVPEPILFANFLQPSQTPDHWNLSEIYAIAVSLGLYLAASTLLLYVVAIKTTWFQDTFGLHSLDVLTVTGLIYLQVTIFF